MAGLLFGSRDKGDPTLPEITSDSLLRIHDAYSSFSFLFIDIIVCFAEWTLAIKYSLLPSLSHSKDTGIEWHVVFWHSRLLSVLNYNLWWLRRHNHSQHDQCAF